MFLDAALMRYDRAMFSTRQLIITIGISFLIVGLFGVLTVFLLSNPQNETLLRLNTVSLHDATIPYGVEVVGDQSITPTREQLLATLAARPEPVEIQSLRGALPEEPVIADDALFVPTSMEVFVTYAPDMVPVYQFHVDGTVVMPEGLDRCNGKIGNVILNGVSTTTYHYYAPEEGFRYTPGCIPSSPLHQEGIE